MRKSAAILFLLSLVFADGQNGRQAFINGVAHIGNGKVIDNALIVIKEGRFEVVTDIKGIKPDFSSYDTVIDLAGKNLYPGLVNTDNILGLHDAEAVRATQDFYEVGQINPHIRALIAYNTDNLIIPTVRCNGVLYTQVTPRGGLISGSSSVVSLAGWNWEDAVIRKDDGIHLTFPKLPVRRHNQEQEQFRIAEKKYQDEIRKLNDFFADAISYLANPSPQNKDLRFEAMRGIMKGAANLYVHADKVRDIQAVIRFITRFKIINPVLVGGRESYKVTSELKASHVPVMLNRVHDLPAGDDEEVDIIYRLPALLQKDSVLFCIQLEGDMEAMQSRNLAYNAGTSVAYGLTREQALMAVSLSAARILGLEKEIGSVEEGKKASFFISEGDMLDMMTSTITDVYLEGKRISTENRQTELYNKYKLKYGIR